MSRKIDPQSDLKAKAQEALLEELESIKTLLDQENTSIDIPLLEEIIDERPEAAGLTLPTPSETVVSDESIDSEDLQIEGAPAESTNNNETATRDHPLPEPEISVAPDGNEAEAMSVAETPNAPGVLPGQQSLFKEHQQPTPKAASTKAVSVKTKTQPKPHENPFLPQHIRKRLSTSKTPKELEPYLGTKTLKAPAGTPLSTQNHLPEEEQQQLIDSLVAEFLPKIEARLRQKLSYILHTSDKSKDS